MSAVVLLRDSGRNDSPSLSLPTHKSSGERSAPQNEDIGERPLLWTCWLDYFATGEGRALMACIAYATNQQEIKAHFAKTFDPYFAKGCDAQEGVVRNEVTSFLWSDDILGSIEEIARRRGMVEAHCWMHFNFS